MTEQNPYLTITLTGARPVKILKADWPVIAEATERRWEGQYEFQSFTKSKMSLRVRQHADGRAIVYGAYDHEDAGSQRGRTIRGGIKLAAGGFLEHPDDLPQADGRDLPDAIASVARDLAERIGEEHFGLDMVELGHECVANLPAVEV